MSLGMCVLFPPPLVVVGLGRVCGAGGGPQPCWVHPCGLSFFLLCAFIFLLISFYGSGSGLQSPLHSWQLQHRLWTPAGIFPGIVLVWQGLHPGGWGLGLHVPWRPVSVLLPAGSVPQAVVS
jgi:hypothetical protein